LPYLQGQKKEKRKKKELKSPYLDQRFFAYGLYIYRQGFQKTIKILLSSLSCSQIWLIPFVDDQQCGYLTKLKRQQGGCVTLWPCHLQHYQKKKYLKAKEEIWKLKYFSMQKHNLQKIL